MYKSLQVSAVILSCLASSLPSQAGSFSDIIDRAGDYIKRGFYRHLQGEQKQPLQEASTRQCYSIDMEALFSAHTISANDGLLTAAAPLKQEENSSQGNLHSSKSLSAGGTFVMDPTQQEESTSLVNINNTLKANFNDTGFLLMTSPRQLAEEVIRRMKADRSRKHPYLGFKGLQDKEGRVAETLQQGYQALFRLGQ